MSLLTDETKIISFTKRGVKRGAWCMNIKHANHLFNNKRISIIWRASDLLTPRYTWYTVYVYLDICGYGETDCCLVVYL